LPAKIKTFEEIMKKLNGATEHPEPLLSNIMGIIW